jgi:flagellum-specific peptidoglycan hydrolase FlgJ
MNKKVQQVWMYCYQHWFKLSLLLLIVLGILKRDFSFSFHFGEAQKIHPKAVSVTEKMPEDKSVETTLNLADNFFSLPTSPNALVNVSTETQIAYLKRYASVVVNERKKCGVSSSFILAVALLQSKASSSECALQSFNQFNLLNNNNWQGETLTEGNLIFRKYPSVWMSFRDHSLYITSGKFAALKGTDVTDYKTWARKLQQLGYAEDAPMFLKEVLDVIEKYQLQRLDRM